MPCCVARPEATSNGRIGRWHLSMPEWLLDGWDRQFGRATADGIAEAFLQAPETYVRNPPDRAGLRVEATDVPGAFRVLTGDISGVRIQDIGSQSVVPLLDSRKARRFWTCAPRLGTKQRRRWSRVYSRSPAILHWAGCRR